MNGELLALKTDNAGSYTYAPVNGWDIVKVEKDVFTAHWDSGFPDESAVLLTLWNGTRVETAKMSATMTSSYVAPAVTCSTETYESYMAFTRAVSFIEHILTIARDGYRFAKGGKVRVVKGRKVPKGEYVVLHAGSGQYGEYVDLDVNGKRVNFVSRDNVELVPDFARCYNGCTGEPFLIKLAMSEFDDVTTWLVFADWCEETEYQTPETCEFIRKLVVSRKFTKFKEKQGHKFFKMSVS